MPLVSAGRLDGNTTQRSGRSRELPAARRECQLSDRVLAQWQQVEREPNETTLISHSAAPARTATLDFRLAGRRDAGRRLVLRECEQRGQFSLAASAEIHFQPAASYLPLAPVRWPPRLWEEARNWISCFKSIDLSRPIANCEQEKERKIKERQQTLPSTPQNPAPVLRSCNSNSGGGGGNCRPLTWAHCAATMELDGGRA